MFRSKCLIDPGTIDWCGGGGEYRVVKGSARYSVIKLMSFSHAAD